MSDFDEIFTVYSQINPAYNRIEIFELPSALDDLINEGQVEVTLGKKLLGRFC